MFLLISIHLVINSSISAHTYISIDLRLLRFSGNLAIKCWLNEKINSVFPLCAYTQTHVRAHTHKQTLIYPHILRAVSISSLFWYLLNSYMKFSLYNVWWMWLLGYMRWICLLGIDLISNLLACTKSRMLSEIFICKATANNHIFSFIYFWLGWISS